MKAARLHPWRVTPAEAAAIQRRLAGLVRVGGALPRPPRLVAGADAAYSRSGGMVFAAVTVHAFPSLELVERRCAARPALFPYVPGLLTFREGPALVDAFGLVACAPDVVIFDGQGILHPRRMGVAAHMGVLLGVPTVGCAKSLLCGRCDEPGTARGAWTAVTGGGERLGACLRTREGVRPVYVSPGFGLGLEAAVETVLSCTTRYRLPEPVRSAHRFAALAKEDFEERAGEDGGVSGSLSDDGRR
ncbi:MAG TPA: endonuclease V [Deltaproteobacteria bacterium]|nr:endonuclease V [Deltaproteobacteria bacterium]